MDELDIMLKGKETSHKRQLLYDSTYMRHLEWPNSQGQKREWWWQRRERRECGYFMGIKF
jgi:hypothetical protein